VANELTESQDIAGDYVAQRSYQYESDAAREMEQWLAQREPKKEEKPGKWKPSVVGQVIRGFAETPRQMVGGVADAVDNAGKLVKEVIPYAKELDDWFNEKVVDLRWDPVSAPKTGWGRIARSYSQFLTGFIPGLRMLEGANITGAGASIVAGAVSDFVTKDPHQGRLADLWNELGLPKNILTDYMASSPEDSDMEARFKNSLEGAGLGLMTEGVVKGARFLRSSMRLRAAQKSEAALLKETYGELTDEAFRPLGKSSDPLFTVSRKLEKAAKETAGSPTAKGLTEASGTYGPDVYVNFSKINGEDDVKTLMGDVANAFKTSLAKSARGVQSHAETERLANDMGFTLKDLLQRRQGEPLNAETALAARKIWAASGEKLLETAKKAAAPNAGAIDQFNFRKMLAVHHAVQSEVIAARTETARALNAWAIPAGSGVEKARALQIMLDASGGQEVSRGMAARLAILADSGASQQAIRTFAERGAFAKTMDAIQEVWVNGLLSLPTTHVVNTSSNTLVALQQIYERKAAEIISGVTGGGVAPGEAAAMTYGYTEAQKDAFRLAWRAIKTGETGLSLNKIDLPRQGALSARNFNLDETGALGGSVDFLGKAFRVPGRLLGAEDEYFKTIGYRAELHAQSVRQAFSEGFRGDDLAQRAAQIVADPSDSIRIAAADQALYQTFNSQVGRFGRAVMNLRGGESPLNPMPYILPFVRTPVNIARYGFERSPFAPLVGQWRADIAAGGARADLAIARMATGTAVMATALDYADSKLISGRGPKDPGERDANIRQEWLPYAVKVGDKWISYNRTDPLGMSLGLAADIADTIRHGEMQEDEIDKMQEVMAMGIAAISQVTINKTYLRGMAEFVNMMQDPTRYSERYIQNLGSSFLPFTALAGGIERAIDPTVRETNSLFDAVQARLAGLSDSLTPRRDLWGREIRSESGLGKTYDFFSPATARTIKPTPIDTELLRLADSPTRGDGALPVRIRKKTSFGGVQVNLSDWPEVYDAYVRMAGNDLKHPAWNMGAKDFLDTVVSGKHPMSNVYNILSDEAKLSFVQTWIGQYRQLAQQKILEDPLFSDFQSHWQIMKDREAALKMPVVQ
jgi:hypothetical protein